jgi:hypothetical protein
MALNQKNKNKRASLEKITPRPWAKRRLRLDLALIAILVWVSWIIFLNKDTVLYQQVSIALIAGGVALLGQYVFGAAWDDKNYMSALNRQNETLGSESSLEETSVTDSTSEDGSTSQIPDGRANSKGDTE